MRDFSKISPSLWRSPRFNALPSDEARLLYLYFLTCEHQTSAGAYWLPDGYACTDLSWTQEKYQDARATLEAADLIMFDQKASVVMIKRWFKHNPPMNEDHLLGIERVINSIESVAIREAVDRDLTEVWEANRAAKPALEKRKRATKDPVVGSTSSHLNTRYLQGRGQRQ